MKMQKRVFSFLLTLALIPAYPASAFDTGAHANITVDAMRAVGASADAADSVQIANWLTDYYTSRPFVGADQCDLEKLHFDDLWSVSEVTDYWSQFTANTKGLAESAARENDVMKFLVVLGMSLHVVQDFYAHSNWVEAHSLNGYHYASWFNPALPRPGGVWTGWYDNCLHRPLDSHWQHGGYSGTPPVAMNHDSYVRPNYDRAYVYAYAASYEWVRNVLDWADRARPGFRNSVLSYQANQTERDRLIRDRNASIYISEWAEKPTDLAHVNGHWQGNPSGIFSAFIAYTVKWAAEADSAVVSKFKSGRYYTTLSNGLYVNKNVPPVAVTSYAMFPNRVLALRTLNINANSSFTNTDSYYGEWTIVQSGYPRPYRDAIEYHVSNTKVERTEIGFIHDMATITSTFQVWNEFTAGSNRAEPIKANQTSIRFVCAGATQVCTGDVSGRSTRANPWNIRGSGINGVAVRFYLDSAVATP